MMRRSSFVLSPLLLALCLGHGLVTGGIAQVPPVVKPPTAPAGAGNQLGFLVDPKVPVVASIEAPLQPHAGEPFVVVVRLQRAAVAGPHLAASGCLVRVQGREFVSDAGDIHATENRRTVEVVANAVGPLEIEVVPYTNREGGRVIGTKMVRTSTVVSETPMRRGGHNGSRTGARLVLTEPVFLKPACSFDGRALFALVGDAVQGFGVARIDTSNGAETAYLPLASFQISKGVSSALTYERHGNRVFVAVGRMHATQPYEVVVLELDADTLVVRRVVRSGALRVRLPNGTFSEHAGTVGSVFSGRDGRDVTVLMSGASPANADSRGACAWFDMGTSRFVNFGLLDDLAIASGNPGLAGIWVRDDRGVGSEPLAAGRPACVHTLTMGPTVRVVEVAGNAARHFAATAQAGLAVPAIHAVAGVHDGRLYVLTEYGIQAYALNVQPPTAIEPMVGYPPSGDGRSFVSMLSCALVHNGRVVVASHKGLFHWHIASNARSAVDTSMLGDANAAATILAILPSTPNQVILHLDVKRAGQPANTRNPAEFAFVLLQ